MFRRKKIVEEEWNLGNISQGLLEFIWTEGCLGRSSNPGPALAILTSVQVIFVVDTIVSYYDLRIVLPIRSADRCLHS